MQRICSFQRVARMVPGHARPHAPHLRATGLALALLGFARADSRQIDEGWGLEVTSGPAQLVGLKLKLTAFAFTPSYFDIEAPLIVTPAHDWTESCPPVYVGTADLQGALVIHVDALVISCSAERITRAAGELGAVGWLFWENAQIWLTHSPEPGIMRHNWRFGDSRALASPVAGDVTQRAGLPLLSALLDGTPIRARARPSRSQWAIKDGWPTTLWSAFFGLTSAFTFELAACRLVSFVRSDGGFRGSIAQLMLLLEMVLAMMRVAFLVVDPFFSRGIYPTILAVIMASYTGPVQSLTTSMFLSYFMAAADNVSPMRALCQAPLRRCFHAMLCPPRLLSCHNSLLISMTLHHPRNASPLTVRICGCQADRPLSSPGAQRWHFRLPRRRHVLCADPMAALTIVHRW